MRILLFILLTVNMVNAQRLNVMTYNFRYDNTGDGVNSWPNRKEKVFALLKKYDPDIIGAQETMHHQLTDIASALPEYEWIGVGREDGKEKGEFSAILYKRNSFEVLDKKTYWLSETPEVVGSKDWDAALTRTATWVRLRDKKSGKTFQLFNTHFDHIGKEARRKSSLLIQNWIATLSAKFKEEVIVTGDFNTERTDEPYAVMMDAKYNLKDAKPADDNTGTFCTFEVGKMECRGIDYIFATQGWAISDYKVIQDNDGKYYPSDHLPVMASFTAAKKKK